MRPPKPLTVKEKRQLDAWSDPAAMSRARVRGYTVGVMLGFLGGFGMVWWVFDPRATINFDDLPFLRAPAEAIGARLTMALFSGVLFAAGMTLVMWRMMRSIGGTRDVLRARYMAAGAEGEPGAAG